MVTAVFCCLRNGWLLGEKRGTTMDTIIFGPGGLGRAIDAALREQGVEARLVGRPAGGRHDPAGLGQPGLTIEASRSEAVLDNVGAGLAAGCRRFVIATTGWEPDRGAVERELGRHGAAAVVAPNLSLGAALFFRLVERATELFGPIEAFDPYLVEWHRRSKGDRPSGTARELARRIIAGHPTKTRLASVDGTVSRPTEPDELELAVVRAGASPGMHLVGFDAAGETIELRLTARDRSAYAAGAVAAVDWLSRTPRAPGFHSFDAVVDELLAAPALAATA
jgi:4-hydroxy-tetrahydrodipicolinate reductase